MSWPAANRWLIVLGIFLLSGCGYRAGSGASRLPSQVRSIAVPAFVNQTQTYRVEQVLTAAVVREFLTRTQYRISSNASEDADLTLRGTVVGTQFAPVTYDSQTGRASSALVTVVVRVSLMDRKGNVVWSNPGYTFRDQYQVSRELSSFFEEDQPAVDRLARDFARTLVSNIVEAY
jgi:outer membrane lipopolysaccharide assembly protein LptE/RlpB